MAAPAPAKPHKYAYDVPVLAGSPWPEMRRDSRNTAESPIRGRYRGDQPWSFKTARGIFSTPVIGDDGTVYVGSADGYFYALGRDGEAAWKFKTGGIIDAAAALGKRRGKRLVPDHDRLRRRDALPAARRPRKLSRKQRVRWRYRTDARAGDGAARQLVGGQRRLRARAATCSSATPAAAPTRSTPGGQRRWVDQRGNSVWTTPAFDARGQQLLGLGRPQRVLARPRRAAALADAVRRLRHLLAGARLRRHRLRRRLRRQPARARPRDRRRRAGAFRPPTTSTARPRWRSDAAGNTTAIYIGSADGSVYAVRPDGTEIWRYETGDADPLLAGARPDAERQRRDRLRRLLQRQALRARRRDRRAAVVVRHHAEGAPRCATATTSTARRRWASAASTSAASTAGCGSCPTTTAARRATRAATAARRRSSPTTSTSVFPVTPGGTTKRGDSEKVPAATVLGTRLVVREGGRTVDARDPERRRRSASSTPPFPFEAQLSRRRPLPLHPSRRLP